MEQKHIASTISQRNIVGSALLYGILFALLFFLPGATALERLRWLDSGICAQMLTHSFYLGGERLPLCARNTGIYLGFLVTLITLSTRGRARAQRLPRRSLSIITTCGVAALAIDGLNSFASDLGLPHLYHPNNFLRLATGLATGLTLAAYTLPLLNRLFWCEFNEKRSITSWKDLLCLLPALALCFLGVASQNTMALYPLALLSSTGVLLALSSINLICLVAISKRDESFMHYSELLPFFNIAFVCSIGEMLILAQLKLTLLHTLGL